MARKEFTKPTRRDALKRSGGTCEAGSVAPAEWYGLPAGERCGNDLARGVHFDHIDLDANSKDNSLSNCAAVCTKCHAWKTAKRDIPIAARTVRQRDKHTGIRSGRGFPKPPPGYNAWTRKIEL